MLLRSNAKIDLIRSTPLFRECSRKDVGRVARIAVERRVDVDVVLMREGEPGHQFFVLVEGAVAVHRKGRRVRTLGPGEFFGEMALLSRAPRTATVTTTEPVRALVIGDRDFVDLLDSAPDLWLKVARALAERIDADEVRESG